MGLYEMRDVPARNIRRLVFAWLLIEASLRAAIWFGFGWFHTLELPVAGIFLLGLGVTYVDHRVLQITLIAMEEIYEHLGVDYESDNVKED